jgi:acyl-CoA thioesterase FadM
MSWLETYRGTVHRWEVDNVDHFTVAYYFARFEDATLAIARALGLDRDAGVGCATVSSHVRYLRELRVGDILHIESGVIESADGGLALGHRVFDSGDGALTTTVEQRVAPMRLESRTPVPLTPAQRAAAERLRVEWTDDRAPALSTGGSAADPGFIDSSRDTVKPWEVDVHGYAAFPAYIHRFSAANGHVLGRFGVTPAYMRNERRGLSTFEFKLAFPGSLRAGDPVLVRSALVHVGNSSMRLLHRMANVETGREVALLEQAGVHLDMQARRPAPLPPELRDRAKSMLVSGGS